MNIRYISKTGVDKRKRPTCVSCSKKKPSGWKMANAKGEGKTKTSICDDCWAEWKVEGNARIYIE